MGEEFLEIVELLEDLLEDVPLKVRVEIESVINMFGCDLEQEDLIKIQEHLENITNMPNIDFYTRNEIFNILKDIARLI